MDFLKSIIKGILTESTYITNVSTAIRQRKEVEIFYDDEDNDPKGSGKRVIQPVAYGLSKAGNLVVRAFQPYGDTKTKVPHWKLFRLDKIKSWKTLWKRSFNEPPAQYGAEGAFNSKGDNSMSEVYLVANFERSREFNSGHRGQGLMNYNKQRQQTATEKDPLYKLKQNISKSTKDKDVTDRVDKYTSPDAKTYVKGNDRYIQDLNKVNNNISTPQTYGSIDKGDTAYQDNYNNKEEVNIENNGPIRKEE